MERACVLMSDLAVWLRARVARCLCRCRVNVQLRLQRACDIQKDAGWQATKEPGVLQSCNLRMLLGQNANLKGTFGNSHKLGFLALCTKQLCLAFCAVNLQVADRVVAAEYLNSDLLRSTALHPHVLLARGCLLCLLPVPNLVPGLDSVASF